MDEEEFVVVYGGGAATVRGEYPVTDSVRLGLYEADSFRSIEGLDACETVRLGEP